MLQVYLILLTLECNAYTTFDALFVEAIFQPCQIFQDSIYMGNVADE